MLNEMSIVKKIVIILGLLLLVACTPGETSTVEGPYKFTGPQAIEAKFVPGSPETLEANPYQSGEEIDVAVELTNRLTETVPAGNVKVRLTGDAAVPSFFSGAKEAANPELLGIDEKTGQPTKEEVELGPLSYVGELTTKISKKLSGQFCYSFPVRVKGFLYYTTKAEEIGTTLATSSNPPSRLQVTAVEQRTVDAEDATRGNLKFKVTVQNTGTGMVLPALSDCFKYRTRSDRESLQLTASGAYDITCDNGGVVRLSRDTKSKTMNCVAHNVDLGNLGKDPSELTLTLSNFAYQEEILPATIWLEP